MFASSDHHFGHANIIKYCSRPFKDWEHMNSEMIEKWNSVVGQDDLVFYLGDLSAGLAGRYEMLRGVIRSLNGAKILVRGNHDHQPDEWYVDAGFKSVHKTLRVGDVFLTHFPLVNMVENGFDFTGHEGFSWVLHGHVHRVDVPNFEDHFNVAVDRNSFTPVPIEAAIPETFSMKFLDEICNFGFAA